MCVFWPQILECADGFVSLRLSFLDFFRLKFSPDLLASLGQGLDSGRFSCKIHGSRPKIDRSLGFIRRENEM